MKKQFRINFGVFRSSHAYKIVRVATSSKVNAISLIMQSQTFDPLFSNMNIQKFDIFILMNVSDIQIRENFEICQNSCRVASFLK